MILKKLTLHPFAGQKQLEIAFQPGLNTVCGPNDIGKSTLFRAIDAALFLDIRPRGGTREGQLLKELIPIRGDHARVSLEFEKSGERYCLEKVWGATPSVQLRLPDGSRLTTPERIDARIREILPTTPATVRSVFLARQGALEQTIQELKENQDSLHSLGDVLRLAVHQTGGVSIDRLRGELARSRLRALGNWDPASSLPRDGRGIERPWQKDVGTVLASFYAREKAHQRYKEVWIQEASLGDKSQALDQKLRAQTEGREFVARNAGTVEAITRRAAIQAELNQATRELNDLASDQSAWLRAEAERNAIEPEVARLGQLVGTLSRELSDARAQSGRKALLERFDGIEAVRRRLEEQKAAIALLPIIQEAEIQRLQALRHRIEKLRTSVSASALCLQIVPKARLGVSLKTDLEAERKEVLREGAPFEIRAGGRIQVGTEYFDLTVTSGDGMLEKVEAQLRLDDASLRDGLARLHVPTLEEAETRFRQFRDASLAVKAAEASLRTLLGKETYEQLLQQIQALQNGKGTRDPEVIQREFADANSQLATKQAELASAVKLIQGLQARHQLDAPAPLTSVMVKKGIAQERLQAELTTLPPLPEGEGGTQALIQEFKRRQSELPALSDEVARLRSEVAAIKATMPEQSAQDFLRLFREAELAFARERKRAQALSRVNQALQAIEATGADVYQGFRTHFEGYVERLSAGKYGKPRLQEALPSDFVRRDGVEVPFSRLSAGTKDGFALLLRLSMAKHFLGAGSGFFLLDDPLVSMDPERKRVSAEILKEFAAQAQVILFTCHPDHARLFEGNQRVLE